LSEGGSLGERGSAFSHADFAIAVDGASAIMRSQLMNEWNIQSRSRLCQACERAFADKQPYHTVLIEEKQQYQRLDLCPACWESQHREGASERKGFISQWQGVYHAPPAAPVDAIQKESAESLLRKLIEAHDPRHGAVCYILAVMLERKRILKVKEQIQGESGRVFVYEQAGTGDVFTIADPNLQLDQLEEVQRATAQLLAHGLNSPPAEFAPVPAETLGAIP
jgi:hypothetical protein